MGSEYYYNDVTIFQYSRYNFYFLLFSSEILVHNIALFSLIIRSNISI